MEQHKEFEAALEVYMERMKPIYHIPTNLGINKFKVAARASGLNKKLVKKLIKAYKKRAWMDYAGIARHRGTFPFHRCYGRKVEVKVEDKKETVKVHVK